MKSETIPSICVEPERCSEAEESSVRDGVSCRRTHTEQRAEFIARGIASLEEARKDGVYVQTDAVLERLETMLVAAKAIAARQKLARS